MMTEVKTHGEFKETKVGRIPEHWEVVRLKKVIKHFESGVSVNGEDRPLESGEVGVLKVSAVSYGIFDPTAAKAVIAADVTRVKTNPKKGHFIVSRANTPELVGASAFVYQDYPNLYLPDKLWQAVIEDDLVDSLYLYYYLQTSSCRSRISNLATGSSGSMKNISKSSFLSIPIPLPPLSEQRRIAEVLSAWDRGIGVLEGLIAGKRVFRRGVARALLSGERRLGGFEGEWTEVRFGDVVKRVKRKNKELDDTVVTISAQRGFVKQEDFFNKRVASKTLSNYTLIKRGEFGYNKSYSNGYPMGAFKRLDDFDHGVVTTLYICFAALPGKVDSDFLMHYLEAGKMIRGLMKIAHEGGRAHGLLNISLPDFFNLKLTLPSLPEQRAIAEILGLLDLEILGLEGELGLLREERRGVVRQMMTGNPSL